MQQQNTSEIEASLSVEKDVCNKDWFSTHLKNFQLVRKKTRQPNRKMGKRFEQALHKRGNVSGQ